VGIWRTPVESRSQTQMIRYFLGELSEEEESRFEEKYFSDDDVFEELQVVEGELINCYVRDELSASERQRFLSFYLNSAERRQRVEDAECMMGALRKASDEPGFLERTSSWRGFVGMFSSVPLTLRLGYATAAIALLAFSIITLAQNYKLRSELAGARTKERGALKHSQDLEQQLAKSNGALGSSTSESRVEIAQLEAVQPLTVSATLRSGVARGTESSGGNELVIQRGTRWAMLRLLLEKDEYLAGYAVVVETADNEEIERVDRLKSQTQAGFGKVVELEIPAHLLGGDTYIVKLLGITKRGSVEDVEDYSFEIVRR